MKKFQVFTDSTSDCLMDFRQQFEIEYLKMYVNLGDNAYDADLDWGMISPLDFYNGMRNSKPTSTGLIKRIELEEKFTKTLEQGLDILYVACSSALSGSVNVARIVAEELLENYPDRKIVCIDSLRSNFAEGMIAIDAAKMALDGMDILEVASIIDEAKLHYQCVATVDTLDYLKRAGRVKASKAFFGNLMGVRPIIYEDFEGNNYSFKKVKGRKASLDYLVSFVKENILRADEATVTIEHADCLKDAAYVKDQIVKLVNPKEVRVQMLGPIIGSTIGPGAITVNFYGNKVNITSGE